MFNQVSFGLLKFNTNISQLLTDFNASYNVFGTLMTELNTTYNVFNKISDELKIQYNINNIIQSDIDTIYSINNQIKNDITTAYNINNTILNNINIQYNINNQIKNDIDTYFSINNRIMENIEMIYNICMGVKIDMKFYYNTYATSTSNMSNMIRDLSDSFIVEIPQTRNRYGEYTYSSITIKGHLNETSEETKDISGKIITADGKLITNFNLPIGAKINGFKIINKKECRDRQGNLIFYKYMVKK